MKKWSKQLLALAVCSLLLITTVFAAAIPDPPSKSCVLDESGVLSSETEEYVNQRTIELDEACGAQIAVLTVDFTGSMSVPDYAYEAFNQWGVGDAKKDNGVFLLLAIGEEDYYCALGTGLEREISAANLDDLLYENLEPGFAVGDYDRGVRDFVDALSQKIARIYGVNLGYAPEYDRHVSSDLAQRTVLLIVLMLVTILILRGGFGFGGFFRRGWVPFHSRWSSGYRSGYYAGRRASGWNRTGNTSSGYRSSGTRSSRSSSKSSFGGFSGGSSRGGGAGRRSSSGGSRPSGGSRSGGAGRRR